jgi:hypothetical protein
MRAEQRSCLYGREKWSKGRPWPYTGYPRNLNNRREKENGKGKEKEKIMLNTSDLQTAITDHERKQNKTP